MGYQGTRTREGPVRWSIRANQPQVTSFPFLGDDGRLCRWIASLFDRERRPSTIRRNAPPPLLPPPAPQQQSSHNQHTKQLSKPVFFIYYFYIQYRYDLIPFICQLSLASFFISAQPRLIGTSRLSHAEPDTAPTTSILSHLPLFVSRSARHSNHHLTVCGSYSTICAFLHFI